MNKLRKVATVSIEVDNLTPEKIAEKVKEGLLSNIFLFAYEEEVDVKVVEQ
jgi:hypothetical protein